MSTSETPEVRGGGGGAAAREFVTAVISLAVVAVGLYMLLDVYFAAKGIGGLGTAVQGINPLRSGDTAAVPVPAFNADTFSRQKDILLLGLGLFGTVIGYYLGRVPAEKQADAARGEASAARLNEMRTRARAEAFRDGVQTIATQNRIGPEGQGTLRDELLDLLRNRPVV